MDFVHLHCHTEFSMLDGASRISDLLERCRRFGMPALAQTDHGAMFGTIPFYESAVAAKVKPILGCELYVATGPRTRRDPQLDARRYHLTALAENATGYRNLLRLATIGYLEGFYSKPRVDMESLGAHRDGIVFLTGCLGSPLDQAILSGGEDGGRVKLTELLDVLGRERLYVEMMSNGLEDQARVNPTKVRLARALGVPIVATNDSHYTDRDDAKLQDLMVCIQTGKTLEDEKRLRFETGEFWFRSPEEMLAAVGEAEWLTRTLEIAERCTVELDLGSPQMPTYGVPEGFADEGAYLRHLCHEMLPQRCDPDDPDVRRRLEHELGIIIEKSYAGYFLVVWDLCRFAREQGILIGFRGSAGGSLVAYVLRIHDLDPLRMGLFFERFLNPERDDPPDIDLDVPDDRRQEIIDYVTRKYGADRVAQVCTFGTMQGRAAIRDAGRALGVPLEDVDRVAKLIQSDGIAKAVELNPDLAAERARDPRIAELVEMAQRLEGLVRHASTHAAAVVISNDPLVEHTPLFRISGEEGVTTQYEMDALKRVGIEKLDILGLKTLTVLANTLAALSRHREQPMTLADIPLDDAATYAVLSRGETSGVFQLESAGMRRLVGDLEPERIEDMIPLVALYRPGPLQTGMTDQYVRRRKGREPVQYAHPLLEPILRETFGVMVYQEQVMQVARDMAGFTLGQADVLRSAMGKKKLDVMKTMQSRFVEGAIARGHTGEDAAAIFENMAQFASYCFNKPHSAMYGIIAYYTAYLKTNHPAEFMAAQLTSFMDDRDRVALYIDEARKFGLEVRPPDVNESWSEFTADSEGQIRFGLIAIKGVGRGAVEAILAARRERPFASLFDFCTRVPGTAVNRAALEALVRAGCFDRFGTRAAHLGVLDAAFAIRQQAERDRALGQANLFGFDEPGAEDSVLTQSLPPIPEMEPELLLADEKNLLGFYVTDNPLAKLAGRLRGRATHTASTIAQATNKQAVTIGGVLMSVRRKTTKKGDRMCFATLQDHQGSIELILFPKCFSSYQSLVVEGGEVLVEGRTEDSEESTAAPRVLADKVKPLPADAGAPAPPPITEPGEPPAPNGSPDPEDTAALALGRVHIAFSAWDDAAYMERLLHELRALLLQYGGADEVVLHLPEGAAVRSVRLGARFRARWGPDLEVALRQLGTTGMRVWADN